MTKKELTYVKTVADCKSISHAARQLYMAQPSLSQAIQRIEDTIGTPLFNRTTAGLSLTYAGERYYHMAAQVLKMYDDFEMEISDINNLRTGRIHFGTTNHLGTLVLPKILPRFLDLCPHVELTITEDTTQELEKKLLSGRLDFVIMHAPKEEGSSQIEYRRLTRDPFVIALSASHPLLSRAIKKPGYDFPVLDVRELKNERFIMLHKQQRIRQVCDSVLAKAGITEPDILLTLKNYETAQLLTANSLGITLLPTQYASITVSNSHLAFCSIDNSYDANWDMCIATLKNNFLSKADQLFIRIAEDIF